ncbi:phytoene desaturase [Aurantibacter crassamenti]|uniref:1-hydroxycarotenoid 3,4-desaturase CrtD n=1 Tax=Aurantibacter crassamenti TaxID=1837375 RepID=UPI00193A2A08|nr:1-hydroxycarotenoid 3,4-desaturase CrtD [Aurantibacter crassamenti]MBM1107025.1 phytoene desaturase [Aurantibacter crassamenti]
MKIAVIGSGIGGMAVACRLASKGHDVTVFEKNASPGGKIDEIKMGGYRFDTGPSLFTLPELVEELYSAAGETVPATFAYKKLEVLCKYFYNSGEQLVAWSDQQKFTDECVEKLGEDPSNISKYFKKASLIYKITADIFLFNSLHKAKNLLKLSVLKSLLQVHKIRFYKTMHGDNSSSFKSPLLVQLFDRYATYNGSNPYKAPATLNVIAHLENNLGAYFPDNGMYSIVQHIYELAIKHGVQFNFNALVTSIDIKNKKAVGITVGDTAMTFDRIVSDSDINYVVNNLMDHPQKKRIDSLEPSSSALVFYWGINKEFPELDLHNILFSADYKKEFTNLFQEKTIDSDPTVYIFVSSKMVQSDAPKNCENWFVMVNAPSNCTADWDELIRTTKQHIINKINKSLNTTIEDYIEHEKIASPITIEQQTFSKGGALYGNSSNAMFTAFLRHPNFLKSVQNLYFVGGSVHPGGGIPLCLASAKIVAKEIPAV